MRLTKKKMLAAYLLQDNGRITNVALGETVGLSPPPTMRMIRLLEQEGYIKSYHAELNAEKFGFHVEAFIRCIGDKNFKAGEFRKACGVEEAVRDYYDLGGNGKVMLRCVFKSLKEMTYYVQDELTQWFDKDSIDVSVVLDTDKKHGIPYVVAEDEWK